MTKSGAAKGLDDNGITHYHIMTKVWEPGELPDEVPEAELLMGTRANESCAYARIDVAKLVAAYNATHDEFVAEVETVTSPAGMPVSGQVFCAYRATQPDTGAVVESFVVPCDGELIEGVIDLESLYGMGFFQPSDTPLL